MLEGITDNTWAIPLATSMCNTVQELIDHAVPLDIIRKTKMFKTDSSVQDRSLKKNTSHNQSKGFIHRFNPTKDKEEDQICFKCQEKGHLAKNCTGKNSSKSQNYVSPRKKTNKIMTRRKKFIIIQDFYYLRPIKETRLKPI